MAFDEVVFMCDLPKHILKFLWSLSNNIRLNLELRKQWSDFGIHFAHGKALFYLRLPSASPEPSLNSDLYFVEALSRVDLGAVSSVAFLIVHGKTSDVSCCAKPYGYSITVRRS